MATALLTSFKNNQLFTFSGPDGSRFNLTSGVSTEVPVEAAHWLARTDGITVQYADSKEAAKAEALTKAEGEAILNANFKYQIPHTNATVNMPVAGLAQESVHILTTAQLVELINYHLEDSKKITAYTGEPEPEKTPKKADKKAVPDEDF